MLAAGFQDPSWSPSTGATELALLTEKYCLNPSLFHPTQSTFSLLWSFLHNIWLNLGVLWSQRLEPILVFHLQIG